MFPSHFTLTISPLDPISTNSFIFSDVNSISLETDSSSFTDVSVSSSTGCSSWFSSSVVFSSLVACCSSVCVTGYSLVDVLVDEHPTKKILPNVKNVIIPFFNFICKSLIM